MSQVFVSYARADKGQVTKLIAALRKMGFDPWWDDDIPAGAGWEETIERALADAQAVIVCWSPTSVASENVRAEARVGRAHGRLVQVFIGACEPPLFFGERQGIELFHSNGRLQASETARLKEALDFTLSGSASVPGRSRASNPAWRLKTAVLAGCAVFIAAAVAGGVWWEKSAGAAAQARIAVLPIEAIGQGSSAASFAEGLTDQIIGELGDGHIPTISRTDSRSLKAGDVDSKLEALGANYTISGTVEQNGPLLHARVHLDDRQRHSSLWSYELSGPANDPNSLNYSISRSIAGVMSCAYRGFGRNGLTDADLLSRYLRACDLFVNHDDAIDAKSTFELLGDLRLITSKAPDFAPAHSDLAKFSAYLAPLMPPQDAANALAESAKEAKRALDLDPKAADAWLARALALPPTEWAKREGLLRRAVSVDRDWPHSNGFLGMFLTETGRMREGAAYGQKAAAADLQIDWRPYGATMACDSGATDSTIGDLRQRLALAPGDQEIMWALTTCLEDAGRYKEAEALSVDAPRGSAYAFKQAVVKALATGEPADRAAALSSGSAVRLTNNQQVGSMIKWYSALGDVDDAFRLARQFSPGHPVTGISSVLFAPQTESMRRDPRFFGLMRRFGLAQFWQSTGRWPDFCSGDRLASCKAADTPNA